MKEKVIIFLSAAVVSVLAGVCLVEWLRLRPPANIGERVPSQRDIEEARNIAGSLAVEYVNMEGQFRKGEGTPSPLPGAWPRFRGAAFDNVCTNSVALAENWPAGGPPVLWSVDLGDGHAGAAVLNGRVYVLDYDMKEQADALRCVSFDDGREIWRRWYKIQVKQNHGMSRTVPAVTGKYVVTIGPRCHVLCVDAATGAFKWGLDLVKDYGAVVPLWYTAQCPLIDGNTVVLAPGGKVLMMGVDCETGRVLWQTPNPRGWKMSHASIFPMTFAGKRMYVYCAIGGMVGVSAGEKDRGTILWETTEWNHAVVAPSPVFLGDGRIFLTAGYGVGSAMFSLSEQAGVLSAQSLYKLDRKVFACEQHTPVWYRGRLFSVLPNDAEENKRQLVCLDPDGKVVWASGKENRFGLGPFLVADDKIFVMNDEGVLTLARASGESYVQLAQAKVLNGRDAWGPMALVNGRLILRDSKRMICLDVRAEK